MSYSWVPSGYDPIPIEDQAPEPKPEPVTNELDQDLPAPPWLQPYYEASNVLFSDTGDLFGSGGIPQQPYPTPGEDPLDTAAGVNESDPQLRFLANG